MSLVDAIVRAAHQEKQRAGNPALLTALPVLRAADPDQHLSDEALLTIDHFLDHHAVVTEQIDPAAGTESGQSK